MRLKEIEKQYHVSYQHNPGHFYGNSFEVEMGERRLLLVAVVKRHIRKRYRVVGWVKPR